MTEIIKVLDKGYVRFEGKLGSDLTPVNAARVSFNRRSNEMKTADEKLLNFLAEHGHSAPFRHAMISFEVSAPLMVARQWFKHCIGSNFQDPMLAWNEVSHRYVQEAEEFYIPGQKEWRAAPANKKQGSGDNLVNPFVPNLECIGPMDTRVTITTALEQHIETSLILYENALKAGVCTEQARLFLPAYGLYIKFYWTCSLQGAFHFLDLRLDSHAQFEIREFAKAVEVFVKENFPVSYQAWMAAKNPPTVDSKNLPTDTSTKDV